MEEHQSVSVVDLQDIQAGPLVPVPTRNTSFLFFSIKDVSTFRTLFGKHVLPHVTTSDVARRMREQVVQAKAMDSMATLAGINVSFSQQGLSNLLKDADSGDKAFKEGQLKRAKALGDDTGRWLPKFKDNPIHGLFEVTGYPQTHVQKTMQDIIKGLSAAITVIIEHSGEVRPEEQKGHEHFGFNDGISQPYVKFQDDDEQQPQRKPLPGQTIVDPGVLVLGQPGDKRRPPWTKNGSFVVYRHLKQLVPEFNDFLKGVVSRSIIVAPRPGVTDSDDSEFKKRVDFLGARLMGRWKSGLPVVLTLKEHGEFPVDDTTIGKDPKLNNNFDYGPRDALKPRDQFRCPFAAHTRKTGPRTDIGQDDVEKHAIRRGGITFGPELELPQEAFQTLHERGLSFVSYQSSVEEGFEFIQRSWSNNENFPPKTDGIHPGFDPIIGQINGGARSMTGFDADNLFDKLTIPQQFIIAQGGEYFFLPSLTTLKKITNPAT